MSTVDIIILAAGRGKRMQKKFPETPKVLVPLDGKPMILRILEGIEASDVFRTPVIVTGPGVDEQIRDTVRGHEARFVFQPEQKGTGHAVLCANPVMNGAENVLVLNGDHPLISADTFRKVVARHLRGDATVTMLTTRLSDFSDWRSEFRDWGRIVRDENDMFARIIEAKDANDEEKLITEVNPAVYCFQADWLWAHLPKVGCDNAQGEYYLPDVLEMAVNEGLRVVTVSADDPRETMGANSPEQLEVLERLYADMISEKKSNKK